MAFIHGSEFLVGSTLLVQNLPSGLSTDHLTQIFKFGTPPVRLKVFFTSTPSAVKRFCLVEFESQDQLRQGVLLHGKEFFGSKLMISLATLDNIPKIDQNMPIETGVGTIVNKFAPPPIEALRPPSRFPPLTPQQTDEVSRTIYVGNVNSEVTQDILQELFETCGKITYIRLAGDDTHPSRFAFIEFLTKEAAQEAMGMNGKILVDRPLKVNHSKNPIVKTPTTTPREEEAIQRRLRRAADRIERSIRREYGRSRSRSKSRQEKSPEKERESREKERKYRSPSPDSYYDDRKYSKRSSSREHYHSSSSRSHHHHHHDPYDKYSHSHSRSSRDRYSRSKYYPEEDYYYRERDYYRDRDRDRDREREKEKEREKYYKEKERRDRKHSSSSHKSSSHHHSSSSSRRDKSSSESKRKRSSSPSSDKEAKKQKLEDKTVA